MTGKLMMVPVLCASLASGCATAPNGNVGLTTQGKTAVGTVVGAGLGGYFGSKVGHGDTKTVATVGGTIVGGAIGNVLAMLAVPYRY